MRILTTVQNLKWSIGIEVLTKCLVTVFFFNILSITFLFKVDTTFCKFCSKDFYIYIYSYTYVGSAWNTLFTLFHSGSRNCLKITLNLGKVTVNL